MKIQRTINEGEMIPFGYGYVRYDFPRDVRLFAPIPLNWIIRWGLAFWLWLLRKSFVPMTPAEINNHQAVRDEAERQLFSHGVERYNAGYEYGFKAGWTGHGKFVLDQLDKQREEERVWLGDPEDGMP